MATTLLCNRVLFARIITKTGVSTRLSCDKTTTERLLASASYRHLSNSVAGKDTDKVNKTHEPGPKSDLEQEGPTEDDPYAPFPDDINPITGEKGGPKGPEPTRYGDWERKGRCIDF